VVHEESACRPQEAAVNWFGFKTAALVLHWGTFGCAERSLDRLIKFGLQRRGQGLTANDFDVAVDKPKTSKRTIELIVGYQLPFFGRR
jgi:hypothetical protein